MTPPILVGVDGTESGRDALALAVPMARATGSALIVASVYPHADRRSGHGDAGDESTAAATLDATRELVADVPAQFRAVPSTSAARALAETAEAEDAGVIVVGSHRSGVIGRVASGGTAERLLHGSQCPVAVAPRGYRKRSVDMFRRIGVAFVDTPEGHEALRVAAGLAAGASCALTVYSVVAVRQTWFVPEAVRPEEETVPLEVLEEYQEALDMALESLPRSLPANGELLYGEVVDELALLGDRGIDLLVTGSRGYGPVRRVLLGTVSSALVRQAGLPVLVVPRSETATAAA